MTRKNSETRLAQPLSSKNKYFTLQLPDTTLEKPQKLVTDGLQSIVESDLHNSKTLPKQMPESNMPQAIHQVLQTLSNDMR